MISKPIFNLDLGFYFEMFMTVPGIWFGAPPISTIVWPSLVAMIMGGTVMHTCLFFIIFGVYTAWWAKHVRVWLHLKLEDYDEKGIFLAYHPFGDDHKKNKLFFVIAPNIPLLAIWLIGD